MEWLSSRLLFRCLLFKDTKKLDEFFDMRSPIERAFTKKKKEETKEEPQPEPTETGLLIGDASQTTPS